MPLTKDSREFIACLHSNKVEFLIVGALAVSLHGYPRYSGDIDFLVKPSVENARRLLSALAQFGFGGLGVELSFIGRDALIRNKLASGRARDLIDVGELKKRV